MQIATPEVQRAARKITKNPPVEPARDIASEEIYAYVSARDSLLAEAEQGPTAAAVKRAQLANEFVVNCLQPARLPYAAQFLSQQEADRELQRCRDASARLAALGNR